MLFDPNTWSEDGTARVWSVATGELVQSLPHGGAVRGVAFTTDGALATGGGTSLSSGPPWRMTSLTRVLLTAASSGRAKR